MKRPWLWTVFACVLLACPIAATLAARAHLRPSKLPRFAHVPPFALVDQQGKPFSSRELDGQVWVADFVFTSCSQVCPKLTGEMAKLQRYLQNRGQDRATRLVSITVDPERDTPERLAAYAAGFHADPRFWKFVTGSQQAVEDAVVGGFKSAMQKEADDGSVDGFAIVHGTRFVLVDGRGDIRGFYDTDDPVQVTRLHSDLQSLVEEGGS